jgi:hypothetical protein
MLIVTALLSPAFAQVVDPLADGPVDPDLFSNPPLAAPINAAPVPLPPREARGEPGRTGPGEGSLSQSPSQVAPSNVAPAPSTGPIAASQDPCAAAPMKPLNQLGINIAQPTGALPTDLAAPCWNHINQTQTGCAATRCWTNSAYHWDATCLCHHPLYFEEINLERYGYQCGDVCCCGCECCLQPFASAAHFYGTVLALPYCIAAECPGDCVYTLGHYRPGDRNPWRWHWPPADPVAALSTAGVYTGLIFAIP